MYVLLVCLPLMGFVFSSLFGRYIGARGAGLLTTTLLALSTLLSSIVFYEVGLCGSSCAIHLSPWFYCEILDISWGFLFDSLTAVMLVVVNSVSVLVHLYSIAYISEDQHLTRFIAYLSLFTFFMLVLVTSNNFIQIFFGWEGIGVSSYLLISFWLGRLQANKASIKAFLFNRVGDAFLALGIISVFALCKTSNFAVLFALSESLSCKQFLFLGNNYHAVSVVCVLLLFGAVGKSAQLGLHVWLPDAIEGPTPVSALIHAATLVTAGVFIIARCSPLFEQAPSVLLLISGFGTLTAFFAATSSIVQNDLKRVIAYSTCSQLGIIVFGLGLSQYSVSMFHLANHAIFKALLFLGAGSLIHSLSDEQDTRKIGGLAYQMQWSYAAIVVGTLALIGFPFLTGSYSKETLLEVGCSQYFLSAGVFCWLGSTSTLLTSYYSFRLLILSFLRRVTAFKEPVRKVHDSPLLITVPLLVLSLGSLLVGYFAREVFIGLGTPFWGNALYTQPLNGGILLESENMLGSAKSVPIACSALGLCIALFLHRTKKGKHLSYTLKTSPQGRKAYTFFNKRWLFDKVLNDQVGEKTLSLGYFTSFRTLDKGFIEYFGPTGAVLVIDHLATQVSKLQSGLIHHYALVMICGLALFVGIFSFWDVLSTFIECRIYAVLAMSILFYKVST
jgi:NADH-ubiquinone oxidoreductase chain 5